jgi:glycosyltransferase involved in cell wall biosynthesis
LEEMLLLLDRSYQGIRGGEAYFSHLHNFLKSNFENMYPEEILRQSPKLENILRHSQYSLELVKRLNPVLVETDVSSGLRNILAVRWAKRHGSKILIVFLERRMVFRFRNFIAVRSLVRLCENYLLKNADIVLVISKYCSNLVKEVVRENTKIVMAYPGLQVPPFTLSEVEAFPRENKSTIELLFVGASDWSSKGLRYLIEAIPALSDIDLRLNIVGGYNKNSHEHRRQEKIINRHRLNDIVKFHGYVDRRALMDFYKSSSIFVLPSLVEGYGMALAEAISFGLPVVASNVAAIPEMIENNINGILVAPKDPRGLADAIRKLARDKNARNRMSQNNLEKAKSLPKWDDFEIALERQLIPAIEQLTPLRAKPYTN